MENESDCVNQCHIHVFVDITGQAFSFASFRYVVTAASRHIIRCNNTNTPVFLTTPGSRGAFVAIANINI